MISDKVVRVLYRNKDGSSDSVDITITGQQIGQTVKRRMSALMPNAQVLDLAEVNTGVQQLDAVTDTPRKRRP